MLVFFQLSRLCVMFFYHIYKLRGKCGLVSHIHTIKIGKIVQYHWTSLCSEGCNSLALGTIGSSICRLLIRFLGRLHIVRARYT